MSQPLTENRYPDVLSVEWSVIALSESTGDQRRYDLYLSLELGHQWESLGDGRLQWGLKGAELNIRLKEGTWSPEGLQERNLSGINGLAIASGTLDGTPEHRTWTLTPLKSGKLLQGSLARLKWGTIETNSADLSNTSIEATISLNKSQVQITDTEGLWSHQMTPNKVAICEQKLALILRESKLQPYISRTLWQIAGEPEIQPPYEPTLDPAQALEIIHKISTAKTDNFEELAQLANLNLAEELAGAKLLGTHLNGLDLSGANLSRVYCRGAELCDVDLSNANLEQANFGGADLSGAFLSEANLEGAIFHRASLALANLSGANLAGADFTEANLSQANLSDTQLRDANFTAADLTGAGIILSDLTNIKLDQAKVNQTRLKDNPGLTEILERSLLERGAIFEGDDGDETQLR